MSARAPKPKKPTRTGLRKQADALWKLKITSRGYCEAADKFPHRCGGVLQGAHIESRGNFRLRWELWNGLSLCEGAHRYFTSHPVRLWLLVERYYPNYASLIRNKIDEPYDPRMAGEAIERLAASAFEPG